jgi:hypothetical protein
VSEETPRGDEGIERGLLRRTLDVCVFAPVGMAVTLAEEVPEFVDKGRQRVQLHLGNAMIVGRFVVTRGQRSLSERLDDVMHGMNDDLAAGRGGSERGRDGSAASERDRDRDRRSDRERVTSYRPESTNPSAAAPPDPAAAAIVERALADYDTLSASQVVRRLTSLGRDELHAVQRYEASTRNRRTILNRASQLLEEGPAAAAGE